MQGKIFRIAGPVAVATGIAAEMFELVRVGNENLMGEVIKIDREYTTIQVYEDTSGLRPGEPVTATGKPLTVDLGPGMLKNIYDGIQRPLKDLQKQMGDYILRGVNAPGIDQKSKWEFKPVVKVGQKVSAGQIIGAVKETETVTHKIMVPPGANDSKIKDIKSGKFTVDDVIGKLEDGTELRMKQVWPVKFARPSRKKLAPDIPLITGQRIFDALFPLSKGGVAAIPGPFGAGKTVSQQQLAKWCDAEIIVYVGCGERGNEMTEVLTEFPHLMDPKTGKPLMERTVLIANTSNMPVAAREASIYTGITIAEYFRDMGYSVAMMADSTSRWAEAMREISSRLEEMPGEEGYPAYLSTRLAQFYERAGRVVPLDGSVGEGSVTVIGAVSPPGGDFSEPVTQNTLRVTKVFWALDAKLAQRRHFPSINWLTSYSLYSSPLEPWYNKNLGENWVKVIRRIKSILQEEDKLMEIVQLVGSDALPEKEQITLEIGRMLREYFLQQNAFHDVDTYSEPKKTLMMAETILHYADKAYEALSKGVKLVNILSIKTKDKIGEVKFEKNYSSLLNNIQKELDKEFSKI